MRGRLTRSISVAAHLHNSLRRPFRDTAHPQDAHVTLPSKQLYHRARPGSSEHPSEPEPSSKVGQLDEALDEETARTTFRQLMMDLPALRHSRAPLAARRKKEAIPSWTAPEVEVEVSTLVLLRSIQCRFTIPPSRITLSNRGHLLGRAICTSPAVRRAGNRDLLLAKRVASY